MSKTVLITGCSSGFGHAAALYFARQGWNVIATMRVPKDGGPLARFPNILVTRLDVQDPDSITRAIADGIERFGNIDAVVNNAGFGLFGVFEAAAEAKMHEQFDVNVFGLMRVTRAILPHFRARRSGTIINITSGAGVFGLPMISLYTATKFAVEGFSESLSYELSALGIAVKIVEPGGVLDTGFGDRSGSESQELNPIADYDNFNAAAAKIFANLRGQRLATSEDVARVIFEAASDGSNRLRYVATDDIVPLVKARRETTEDTYMTMMRARFPVAECEGCAGNADVR
ncbi:SDR family oxidoreductase [Noviherbaspirillum aerium]|uniref:SDR family oxidoreductase n=1 Tax=Noviherbaspirillum aerium TaxID=2588497 RepID=UPI00124EF958|nr:SDR family oxidoreductase [Noviherbaspirillum aerium]